jgi:integrase
MPKKAKELTALAVKNLTTPGHYSVGGVPGLALQVAPAGTRSWVLRYKAGAKRRDMGLGAYPTISLQEARKRAAEAHKSLGEGRDPILERESARNELLATQASAITFEQAAGQFIKAKRHEWTNPKHENQWTNTLEEYAFPVIGRLSVARIELSHILKILEPIWTTKTETATRVRNRIENILDWAKARGYRQGDNPAAWRGHLDKILPNPAELKRKSGRRQPALPVTDAPSFFAELRQKQGLGSLALQLQILTATRSGEVRGANWSEFDLERKIWTIPAERMKAKIEHSIPLSTSALTIIKGLAKIENCSLLFPGKENAQLSENTLNGVIKKMNQPEVKWRDPKQGNAAVVPHGFRSTFRDWVSEHTTYGQELGERALAHSLDSTEAAYSRSGMIERRRQMMEEWADYLKF